LCVHACLAIHRVTPTTAPSIFVVKGSTIRSIAKTENSDYNYVLRNTPRIAKMAETRTLTVHLLGAFRIAADGREMESFNHAHLAGTGRLLAYAVRRTSLAPASRLPALARHDRKTGALLTSRRSDPSVAQRAGLLGGRDRIRAPSGTPAGSMQRAQSSKTPSIWHSRSISPEIFPFRSSRRETLVKRCGCYTGSIWNRSSLRQEVQNDCDCWSQRQAGT